jgi:hypothetical protein
MGDSVLMENALKKQTPRCVLLLLLLVVTEWLLLFEDSRVLMASDPSVMVRNLNECREPN